MLVVVFNAIICRCFNWNLPDVLWFVFEIQPCFIEEIDCIKKSAKREFKTPRKRSLVGIIDVVSLE